MAKKPKTFIPCVGPPPLPDELLIPAAMAAMRENPVNAPAGTHSPARLGVLASRYWGAKGVDLAVGFMETTSAQLQQRILDHMNAWQSVAGANVTFRLTAQLGSAQVRITRGGDGYWSYLGTDIGSIPANQPTMCLQGFTMSTPESEYRRVVRHETGHCFAGDTLIDCPRDLEKYPLGVPIRDLVGTQPWVYAWQNGRAVVRPAARVWLSLEDARVVRVKLRAGRGFNKGRYNPPMELVGTPDHRVLLADGVTWKELGSLEPGDRLCSLYRQGNGGRSRIRWTNGPDRVREHAFVCEQVHGVRPDGHDAHHRNERKLDQTPENLEWKLERDHHADHSSGRKDGPETFARRSAAAKGRLHTAETKRKMSQARKGRKLSEDAKAKLLAAAKGRVPSEETLKKRSESMKRFYAAGNRSGMYGKSASEATRQKQSESVKAAHERKRLAAATANHVVVSVEEAGTCDVYDMTVPGAESFVANGVFVHNCLGFPHEHMRSAIVALLDPEKTIAYFGRYQGWDRQTVIEQVLTPVEDSALIDPTRADGTSIMCYQLSGAITRSGQPIVGGSDLDELDRAYAARVYPSAVAPPPPPPPSGGAGPIALLVGLDAGGKEIARFRVQ